MSVFQSEISSRGTSANPYGISERQSIEDYYAERERKNREQNQNIHMIKTSMQKFNLIPMSRMDQGVATSVIIEIKSMCIKVSYVFIPRSDDNAYKLRNWDLWGPFFMCIVYAFFINNSSQFLLLFFGSFVGAYIVMFNVKLLGGQISYFQAIAILGYCMFPLFIGMLILKILLLFGVNNTGIDLGIVLGTILWCIISSRTFVGVNVPSNRKFVALYPIILFYVFLGMLLVF